MLSRVALAVAVALVVGCVGSSEGRPLSTANPGPVAFVLLADGRLARVSPVTGRVERLLSLRRASFDASGRVLALARARGTVLAMLPRPGAADELLSIDVRRGSVRTLRRLDPAVRFRSIAVGRTTRRIYLAGNVGGSAVVHVLTPDGRRGLARWTARSPDGRNWFVYVARLSSDERLLYVSYHGADTSGADVFDVATRGRRPCGAPPPPISAA